jgi:hypothetical protein
MFSQTVPGIFLEEKRRAQLVAEQAFTLPELYQAAEALTAWLEQDGLLTPATERRIDDVTNDLANLLLKSRGVSYGR